MEPRLTQTPPGKFAWIKALVRKPSHLILVSFLGLFAGGVLAAAVIALAISPTLPSVQSLTDERLKVPMRVYTQEGILLAEFGEEKRIPVKIDEVPDLLIKAILAAEDDSFYFHQGVDFLGIVRATLANLREGRNAEGASTITMQVARNYFLTPEKTYTRKLREILLAFKIERELTKDQILELYINKIFLGNRSYGFAAAAQIYYGKPLVSLTLPEMAMLAGLPKAPSRDNPLNNPDNARARRDYVLGRMLKLGYIDEVAHDEGRQAPPSAGRHALQPAFEAPYIAEMVRQYMFATYSENTYDGGFHVYTTIRAKDQQAADKALRAGVLAYERRHGYRGPAGRESIKGDADQAVLDDILKDYQVVGGLLPAVVLKVEDKTATAYTQDGATIALGWSGLSWAARYISEDARGPAPKRAADAVHVGDIIYVERIKEDEWALAQVPHVSGAIIGLRPSDGAINALAGGFDFYQSKFNRAVQAQRQPGSNLKPFIYAAALEKGFTTASLVSGAPVVVEDANLEDEWRPEDYSRKFYGPTRLRKALTLSLNLVAVRLLRAIEPDYAADYMERFGFDSRRLPRSLSLALGSAQATPIQMVSAFAVFANGGYRVEPYFIERIEDADHKVLEQANPTVICPTCPDQPAPVTAAGVPGEPAAPPAPRYAPRAISPPLAFLMTSMMRDVITGGTAMAAMELGRRDLAGKTGTTNDHRDAWFTGFNSDMVTTAWVGFDSNTPLGAGEVGGRTALPIWMDYMRVALDGVPEKPLVPPAGVVSATINSETGHLTDASDPQAMREYFLEGTLPADGGSGSTEGGPTTAPPPEGVREGLF
jgi:penicillin-binding protein 1A